MSIDDDPTIDDATAHAVTCMFQSPFEQSLIKKIKNVLVFPSFLRPL
jgi:hypothetical protein